MARTGGPEFGDRAVLHQRRRQQEPRLPSRVSPGYAVFGHVTAGMDVVKAIAGVETGTREPHGRRAAATGRHPFGAARRQQIAMTRLFAAAATALFLGAVVTEIHSRLFAGPLLCAAGPQRRSVSSSAVCAMHRDLRAHRVRCRGREIERRDGRAPPTMQTTIARPVASNGSTAPRDSASSFATAAARSSSTIAISRAPGGAA